jgi:hypothetical protein
MKKPISKGIPKETQNQIAEVVAQQMQGLLEPFRGQPTWNEICFLEIDYFRYRLDITQELWPDFRTICTDEKQVLRTEKSLKNVVGTKVGEEIAKKVYDIIDKAIEAKLGKEVC